jgi:hypothetical protein
MSIYAYADGDDILVVTAATSLAEYDDFYARAAAERADYASESQPDVMGMLLDPIYSRLKKPPYVFQHLSSLQRDEFVNKHKIILLGPNAAIDHSNDMIDRALRQQESAIGERDTRTIGEALGLTENDPWDKRSEEQKEKEKAAQEKYKKAYDEAQKRGTISGDSFSSPQDKKAHVTDIRTTIHSDGSITIDNVRAVKGLHEKSDTVDQHVAEERARVRADAQTNYGDYTHPAEGEPVSKRASDYAFGVADDVVAITSRRMFDAMSAVDDVALTDAIGDRLPPSLIEVEPGIFHSSKLSGEALATVLEAAGFSPNTKLHRLVNGLPLEPVEGEEETQPEAAPDQFEEKRLADNLAARSKELADVIAQRTKRTRSGNAPAGVISEDHEEKKAELGPPDFRDANGDNIAIANDGLVSVYFKVEVEGEKLETVLPFLEGKGFPLRAIYESRDHTAGCWFVSVREASSSDAYELLTEGGYKATFYGCDQNGEALAPAEIEIVDTEASEETPIRPWNERRRAWDRLTDEEKVENRKTWKGSEFVITGEYDQRTGCSVLITPRSYFYENNALFPELLDLTHILPDDLKLIDDAGWYNTKSRGENVLMTDLCVRRGFIDDWTLRLFLNQQGR